jgi:hypothetical protein
MEHEHLPRVNPLSANLWETISMGAGPRIKLAFKSIASRSGPRNPGQDEPWVSTSPSGQLHQPRKPERPAPQARGFPRGKPRGKRGLAP